MKINIISHHIRRAFAFFLFGLLLGLAGPLAAAQKAGSSTPAPDSREINRVVSKFTSGETELLEEFGKYGFRRDLEIQSLRGRTVIGKYHRISEFTVGQDGRQVEKIISLPMPSGNIVMTAEDLENFTGSYQFPLQSANAKDYRFSFINTEQLDNSNLYVFDVRPVSVSSQRRLFLGRVWIDVATLRIVKMRGKFEQKGNQKFPVIETQRALVDNRFPFPANASADDELVFANQQTLHLRITISFTDYVRLR